MNTETTNEADTRITLLAKHLGIEPSDISISKYDDDTLDAGGLGEYLVLEDDDADTRCKDYILETLWAFNASFLERYIETDDSDALIESIQAIQGKLCESCNSTIKAMLGSRLNEMIDDAISEDGRGHFLAGYDSEEIELAENGHVKFYAYRTN
jgi:hypothetical protein